MNKRKKSTIVQSKNEEKPKMRVITQNSFKIFLPVFILMLGVMSYILYITNKSELKTYQKNETQLIDMQIFNTKNDLFQAASDIILLANLDEVKELWDSKGKINNTVLEQLSTNYKTIAFYKKFYDHLHLIDENGNEILRVNYLEGEMATVVSSQLQHDSDCDYFSAAFKINQGEVFVSSFELNKKQGEIELPFKPVIRFATPVFDNNDEKRGIVMFSYLGDIMLDNFSSHVAKSKIHKSMLLNAQGFYIVGPNPENDWAFMYDDRQDRSFAAKYPTAWSRIIKEDSSQFITPQGMFTAKTIYPLMVSQTDGKETNHAISPIKLQSNANEYFWKVATFIPASELYSKRNKRFSNTSLIAAILTLIFALSAYWISVAIIRRKQAEEQIKQDLRVKTALLQELYHRTKNNMQLIASMLKMQSRSIENKSLAGVSSIDFLHDSFDAIINRIKAMSMVHQKLYQAEDLSHINLKEYIKDLVNLLMISYHIHPETISVKLELEDMLLLIDSAIPISLVLNELISNVFKHAFPDNAEGEISIRLFKEEDETINIHISDNGVGIPEDIDLEIVNTIGIRTVYSLAKHQLNGEVNYKTDNGLKWQISFKDDQYKVRV
ncbi:MAG: sensor histidine kinase [Candidatus Cloacimonetes bacterium]|jgi:two-component sensor histidine kinase|nr:sensor histidine kinase [Candidatus Cloacimonadota bacterium]